MSDASRKQRGLVEPGSIIAEKYRVERQVGKGGMGYIVAARHVQLDELVALKFLLAPEERAEEFQERFLREARITAKLRSVHVARTLDYGVTDDGDPFMVMEYLEGITLRQLLRQSGPLPVEAAVSYGLQVCEGLAAAHRLGVVHRDLKPANLFLTKDIDGGDLVKILDFGVSKLRNFAAAQSDLTAAGMLIGSPRYMAIEQLTNAGEVDERADVWSLGAILYEMLLGHSPFPGDNTTQVCLAIMRGDEPPSIRQSRPEIPEALDRAVLRCLSRDIELRTPDVAVLARELADGSGLAGIDSAAKAVEDVLAMQVAMSSTGQLRAFGQTGSCPSASGTCRPVVSRGSTSASNALASGTEKTLAEGGAKPRRARSLLLAVAGIAVVAALVAIVLSSGATSEEVVATDTATAQPTIAPSGATASELGNAHSLPEPARAEDATPGNLDAGKPKAARTRRDAPSGRPPPARPKPVADKTPKDKPPPATKLDPFGSRY